jgi:putative transposase
MSIEEKRQMLEPKHPKLSLNLQCQLLGIARSTAYYEPKGPSEAIEKMMRLLDRHYTDYPFTGKVKRALWLSDQMGYPVGIWKVRRLMKQMGLETVYPKPDTSVPNRTHEVYPYLLREIDIKGPDHVWCADITYIPLGKKHAYLFAILDWYSRYVIAWSIAPTLEAQHCVRTLTQALEHKCCDIFNTDQGSQFTSREWIDTLSEKGVSISMDGRGCYFDNIFVERLWRTVKQECIYLHDLKTIEKMRLTLHEFFHYYNHERLHQGLGYKTPAEVYFQK